MSDTDQRDRVGRDVRILKAYAVASTIVLGGLLVSAASSDGRQEATIDVERINVRNPDGGLALSIAGQGLLPGPTFGGTEYPQRYSGGRRTASGMIFFNERGDEVGGLTYHGRKTDDGYTASGGITFDQFRQDQVVSLQYQDDGSSRQAGLRVWDRSPDITIDTILQLVQRRDQATGAERDSVTRAIEDLADQGLAADRVFLGSANRTAMLLLRDPEGAPRIRLYVDSTATARLEFLDSAGEVVEAWPR